MINNVKGNDNADGGSSTSSNNSWAVLGRGPS